MKTSTIDTVHTNTTPSTRQQPIGRSQKSSRQRRLETVPVQLSQRGKQPKRINSVSILILFICLGTAGFMISQIMIWISMIPQTQTEIQTPEEIIFPEVDVTQLKKIIDASYQEPTTIRGFDRVGFDNLDDKRAFQRIQHRINQANRTIIEQRGFTKPSSSATTSQTNKTNPPPSLISKSHGVWYTLPLYTGEKPVAITFDDGPWEDYTLQVLLILKQMNIHATFFWLGANVQRNPALARRVIEDGHLIGNHSYHHYYKNLSEAIARQEIELTEGIIRKTTGIQTRLFRPPGGYLENGMTDQAIEKGYEPVLWSVDPKDYRATKNQIIQHVLHQVQPGSIILLHDGGGNRTATVQALPILIKELRSQGYEFVTLQRILNE